MTDSNENQTQQDNNSQDDGNEDMTLDDIEGEGTEYAKEFVESKPGVVPIELIDAENTLLIYEIRHLDGYYITGDIVNWEYGWRYEDYNRPHVEKAINLTEEEAGLVQEIIGENISEVPDENENKN